ncbi:hypothetical protein Q5P01_025868 [Channa striata]|uniref:Uncharacterized protein n=1 Tax=Channa striata TaxID=64152 RepID=A0AA88LFL9_CHASR|nr:hypothetical protein Q5P01_025868 [Channa striata]
MCKIEAADVEIMNNVSDFMDGFWKTCLTPKAQAFPETVGHLLSVPDPKDSNEINSQNKARHKKWCDHKHWPQPSSVPKLHLTPNLFLCQVGLRNECYVCQVTEAAKLQTPVNGKSLNRCVDFIHRSRGFIMAVDSTANTRLVDCWTVRDREIQTVGHSHAAAGRASGVIGAVHSDPPPPSLLTPPRVPPSCPPPGRNLRATFHSAVTPERSAEQRRNARLRKLDPRTSGPWCPAETIRASIRERTVRKEPGPEARGTKPDEHFPPANGGCPGSLSLSSSA